MSNDFLAGAAASAMCDILSVAGETLVGVGVISSVGGPIATVPLSLGALSILGSKYACAATDVDDAPPTSPQIDGCAQMEVGGYGNFQFATPTGSFQTASGQPAIYQRAFSLGAVTINEFQGVFTPQIEVFSATDGTTFGGAGNYSTRAQAEAVRYRIDPVVGDCADTGDLPVIPPDAFDERTYTDPVTNCEYNIQLLGFVEPYPGGPTQPVFKIEDNLTSLLSSGARVGGCNFEPTVYYPDPNGPGGPGGGDKVFPYVDGDDPNGSPKWLNTLLAALAGAGGAVVVDIIGDLLAGYFDAVYPGLIYRMVSVCEKDASGEPISESVDVTIPTLTAPDAQLARLDAIVELLQAAKNFKQPVCPPDRPDLLGDWVTVRFESVENSPQGTRPLRKLFRYRSQSALDLGQIASYWENFTWNAGPVCVQHKNASWGTPQCWAANADEGKRVIRFAGLEAGIDPDAVGEWVLSGSSDPRFGMAGSMRVAKVEGLDWITSRQGPSGLPLLTVDP